MADAAKKKGLVRSKSLRDAKSSKSLMDAFAPRPGLDKGTMNLKAMMLADRQETPSVPAPTSPDTSKKKVKLAPQGLREIPNRKVTEKKDAPLPKTAPSLDAGVAAVANKEKEKEGNKQLEDKLLTDRKKEETKSKDATEKEKDRTRRDTTSSSEHKKPEATPAAQSLPVTDKSKERGRSGDKKERARTSEHHDRERERDKDRTRDKERDRDKERTREKERHRDREKEKDRDAKDNEESKAGEGDKRSSVSFKEHRSQRDKGNSERKPKESSSRKDSRGSRDGDKERTREKERESKGKRDKGKERGKAKDDSKSKTQGDETMPEAEGATTERDRGQPTEGGSQEITVASMVAETAPPTATTHPLQGGGETVVALPQGASIPPPIVLSPSPRGNVLLLPIPATAPIVAPSPRAGLPGALPPSPLSAERGERESKKGHADTSGTGSLPSPTRSSRDRHSEHSSKERRGSSDRTRSPRDHRKGSKGLILDDDYSPSSASSPRSPRTIKPPSDLSGPTSQSLSALPSLSFVQSQEKKSGSRHSMTGTSATPPSTPKGKSIRGAPAEKEPGSPGGGLASPDNTTNGNNNNNNNNNSNNSIASTAAAEPAAAPLNEEPPHRAQKDEANALPEKKRHSAGGESVGGPDWREDGYALSPRSRRPSNHGSPVDELLRNSASSKRSRSRTLKDQARIEKGGEPGNSPGREKNLGNASQWQVGTKKRERGATMQPAPRPGVMTVDRHPTSALPQAQLVPTRGLCDEVQEKLDDISVNIPSLTTEEMMLLDCALFDFKILIQNALTSIQTFEPTYMPVLQPNGNE